MITSKDIVQLKSIFITKEEFSSSIREIISFIGETREILTNQMDEFRSEMNKFRNEVCEFRNEMRDINHTNRSTLDNHETRLSRIEYVGR